MSVRPLEDNGTGCIDNLVAAILLYVIVGILLLALLLGT